MREFDKFINDLLDISGINDFDKMDLKDEIQDHLMLLKLDYINKGYSERNSIKLAIRDFGEENFIEKEIKRNLPSKNKTKVFYKKYKIKCMLGMFLSYYIFIFLSEVIFKINHRTLMFNIFLATIPSLIGFIYINMKIANHKNKLYNLKFILLLYFVIEKIIISGLVLMYYYIKPNELYLSTLLKNAYIFNNVYISSYIIFYVILILIQIYIDKNKSISIKNPYDSSISSAIIGSLSIMLMIVYFLFPNRWYLLHCIIEKIIQCNIKVVSKNIIFILINNNIVIPNLGLILFIFLILRKTKKE